MSALNNFQIEMRKSLKAPSNPVEPPFNVGVTGDICYRCQENAKQWKGAFGPADLPATSNLYLLSCHSLGEDELGNEREEFLCENCITKEWTTSITDFVQCPWCHKDPGFTPLAPLDQRTTTEMVMNEINIPGNRVADPGTAGNLISVNRKEALACLSSLYVNFTATNGGSAALGGVSGFVEPAVNPCLQSINRVIHGFDGNSDRFASTPERIEARFTAVVRAVNIDLAARLGSTAMTDPKKKKYALTDASHAVFLESVMADCQENLDPSFARVYNNWVTFIGHLVTLLCWRHRKRLAHPETQ